MIDGVKWINSVRARFTDKIEIAKGFFEIMTHLINVVSDLTIMIKDFKANSFYDAGL